jgi:hypothetical protein
MSTDIVKFASYAVAQIEPAELQEILADNLGGEDINRFALPTVKVPSGGGRSWELQTTRGVESIVELEGVIVAHGTKRAFYPGKYEGGNQPPSCASEDAKTGTGYPHATADEPYPDEPPTTLECAECPNSQWGSAADGRGQACGLRRVLALLRPSGVLPIVVDLGPTSTRAVRDFLLGLASEGISYKRAIVGITLEPATNATGIKYSRAVFALKGVLDDEELTRVREIGDAVAGIL